MCVPTEILPRLLLDGRHSQARRRLHHLEMWTTGQYSSFLMKSIIRCRMKNSCKHLRTLTTEHTSATSYFKTKIKPLFIIVTSRNTTVIYHMFRWILSPLCCKHQIFIFRMFKRIGPFYIADQCAIFLGKKPKANNVVFFVLVFQKETST